jgi:lipid A ethanolaminephosphotransferase
LLLSRKKQQKIPIMQSLSRILNSAKQTIAANRIEVSPITLIAGTALFILAFYNKTYFAKGIDIFSGSLAQFALLVVALYFLIVAVFTLFGSRLTVKPLLAFMLILSSATSYYMDNLGVIIDRSMIQNVAVTTFDESKKLITFSFVLQLVLWGILPALVIFWFKLKPTRFWRALLVNTGLFSICIVITIGLLFVNYKTYSSVFRERKDFMGSQQPGAALVGTVRYIKMISQAANLEIEPIGTDAIKGPEIASATKPVLTILVIGETARSQDFSLNGYERNTNPELSKLPVIDFTDVDSCGTATAVSLPCMFSKFDRSTYSYNRGVANENLVDVLQYAGLNVVWWDNNTGSKGLADRITYKTFYDMKDEKYCGSDGCQDGIFQKYIEDFADTIKEDTVLIIHQAGSHGPTYFERYPDAFEVFKPACKTAEFKKCTQQQILNTYDNTILYTDYNLANIIKLLASKDNLLTSMFYISDHGESLGENGLYLHGAPYLMAPETQTKVPMIVWLSSEYKKQFGIDQTCLEAEADNNFTQGSLFHSILGLMDVKTSEHKDALDLFAPCKS